MYVQCVVFALFSPPLMVLTHFVSSAGDCVTFQAPEKPKLKRIEERQSPLLLHTIKVEHVLVILLLNTG